jgi:DNA-binding transcriptional LysR family regulator
VRSRTGCEPTDFGRVILQRAAELLAQVGDLEREVALARGLGGGELSVAMGPYAADVIGPACALRFAAASPGVRLRARGSEPAAVAQLLRARSVDLGIADASVLDGATDLETVARLSPVHGCVVVRAGHPLAGRADVQLADALRYPFAQVVMLPPRLLASILAVVQAASARGDAPPSPFPAIECPSLNFALRIVANSDAFTFTSLGLVRAELESGRIVPILREPWARVEWNVVSLRTRTPSPTMLAFVEAVQRAHADVLDEEAALGARWFAPPTLPARGAARLLTTSPGGARRRRQGR